MTKGGEKYDQFCYSDALILIRIKNIPCFNKFVIIKKRKIVEENHKIHFWKLFFVSLQVSLILFRT